MEGPTIILFRPFLVDIACLFRVEEADADLRNVRGADIGRRLEFAVPGAPRLKARLLLAMLLLVNKPLDRWVKEPPERAVANAAFKARRSAGAFAICNALRTCAVNDASICLELGW